MEPTHGAGTAANPPAGLGYWMLSGLAGLGWGYLGVSVFHLDVIATGMDMVLATGIGVLMGALILPWMRGRTARPQAAFLLGLMTLVIAAPLFVIAMITDDPTFHFGWGIIYLWAMVVMFCLTMNYGLLVLLACFTVYGLWRWLDLQNRQIGAP